VRQYYVDTSVLPVYALAGGSEPKRYSAVRKLFTMIEDGRLKAVRENE